MNLSSIAVRRPVFTVMVTVALLVLGFVGYGRLGTDLFPDVSFPVVAVNIVYPGAGPTEVETLVSKPIEDAVVSLNGIDRVRTLSREGLSTTIVFFKLGVDIADAATQVRERVAQSRFKLPADVKEPTVNRFDVSAAPILTYTLRGNRPLSEVRKFADDVIRPALEQVDGVASVDVRGGAQREVHVEDPSAARFYQSVADDAPNLLTPPDCAVADTWACEVWNDVPLSDIGDLNPGLQRSIRTLAHYRVAVGYSGATCTAGGKAYPCYGPSDPVTFAQTISFITRAMIAKGYWVSQPNAPLPFAGVPDVLAKEVRTFTYYTGGVPAPPSNWNAGATRGWFAQALWAALNDYWGTDAPGNGGYVP